MLFIAKTEARYSKVLFFENTLLVSFLVFYSKTVFSFILVSNTIEGLLFWKSIHCLAYSYFEDTLFLAWYYRFRSRSAHKRLYSTGIKKHAFQTVWSCFRSTEGNRFGSKEPREHDSTRKSLGILSCLRRFPSRIDSTQDGSRQRSAPGSADRSADFGQGFGQAWRAVAQAAGIFLLLQKRRRKDLR